MKAQKKKLVVRVIGPEVFGLTKRERMKWFKAPFCREIGRLLGESQVDNSRYHPNLDGMIMVGCILMLGDVWKILCNPLMRYLVTLGEADSDTLHGIFIVRTTDDFVFTITDFFIESEDQHKGHGSEMLDAFMSQLRKDRKGHPTKVEIAVALGNDNAAAFYAKAGFRETAREMQVDLND